MYENQNAILVLKRRIDVRIYSIFPLALLGLMPLNAEAQVLHPKWSLYALGGFSVALPSEPISQTAPNLPEGFRSWSALMDATSYVFSLNPIRTADQSAPPDALLAQCVSGILSSREAFITGERDLLLDGWPGVEIRYRIAPNTDGRLRAFVVKNQILNLVVTHPLGSVEPDGATKFFGSAALPSDVEKGTLSQPGPTIEKFDLESSGFTARVPKGVRSATQKIGEGAAAVNMHRFATAFLNRVYMGVVIDPPAGASIDLDGDVTGKPAQAVNASIASLFGQKITKTGAKETTLGKDWTADFDLGHALTGHLETYIRNNHTYSLLAIVPGSMILSEEVKGFFDSATLPKKG